MFEEFSGTKPVADTQSFDRGALAGYLGTRIEGFARVAGDDIVVAQFKGGQSNPTYKLTVKGRNYVMRSKPAPAAKLLPSAHAIEREFRVQDALQKSGFPAARMHVLCEDEAVIGRAFYIMEMLDGRVLWDQALPEMDGAGRAAIYAEMNRVIARLHRVDYKAIGLETFGKPSSYLARQIERWSKQYKLAETENIPAMDRLIEWLPRNIPAGDETCIVHGDYRLDNMVFHPTEPRVLGVLDWELSTLGHPLADFSYHCMSWHIAPGQVRGIGGLDHGALGIPAEAQYIAMYAKNTGRPVATGDWGFYMAYNMFRMCGILQGIMKRYVDGTAASQQALDAGSRARPMAEMGWAQVERIRRHA